MTIRERIKDLCKEEKISINKLEQDLEFGKGYISKLDTSVPNGEKLNQIAKYLNVSLDYLVNGERTNYDNETVEPCYFAFCLLQRIFNNKAYFCILCVYYQS